MIQDKENKVHPELYGDFSAKSKGKNKYGISESEATTRVGTSAHVENQVLK